MKITAKTKNRCSTLFPSLALAALSLLLILMPLHSSASAASAAASKDAGSADAEVPWKIRAELSYVNTSGNTDTQTLAGKLDLKREGTVDRYFTSGSYLKAEDSGTDTSDKLKLEGRYERVFTGKYFGLFTLGYLRDKFSGYEYRAYGGPGAGIEFIKTPTQKLQGHLSILYNHNEFSTGVKTGDNYVTAKATGKYERKVLENLTFKETFDYFTSVEDSEVYFVDSVTAVEVKVNGRISVGMSYTINYQNRPPSPELNNTDTTLLTNLIIDF